MARHYSPPGTYERIYKHLLEDPTITDAEARLICYLATLPPDWEIHPRHLQAELGRSANWVRLTMRALRHRGLIYDEQEHGERGTFGKAAIRFRRDLIVAPPPDKTAGQNREEEIPPPGDGQEPAGQHREGEIPPPGDTHREEEIPPPGADQAGHSKTAGRNREKVSPLGGKTTSHYRERTHTPRENSLQPDRVKTARSRARGPAIADDLNPSPTTDDDGPGLIVAAVSAPPPPSPPPPATSPTPMTEGTPMEDQTATLFDTPGAARRARTPARPRTADEAALNGRAGKITDAWTSTQPRGLNGGARRTSVHQLVKRVLGGGEYGDDAVQAALLGLATRGITPTAAALARELRTPAATPNGHVPGHQVYKNPADQSVYRATRHG